MSIHREPGKPRPYRVKWREGARQRSRSFATERDAVMWQAECYRRAELGAHAPAPVSRMLLADWIETWIRLHGPTWAPSTRKGRSVYADKWIVPYVGDMPLRDLGRQAVNQWRAAILRDGASANTVNHATRVLSACLGRAVEEGLIPANPVAGLRRMRHLVERPRALAPDEVVLLLEATRHPRDARLVAVMAYAGLRPGEAIALRWEDIDVGVIHVSRSVRIDGSISTPKTGHGRVIRIRPELRPYLNGGAIQGVVELCNGLSNWKAGCAELEGSQSAGLVAPAAHGGPLNYRGWYRNSWVPLRERTGVRCTPYDLRHTFASQRIADGASVVEVAQEMGHADPSMTLRRYAHLIEGARHAASI